MSTWQDRVRGLFGPKGYDNATMRRSLQAIILYEAKRCASKAIATMKPFQRKAAFLDQCCALVESLDVLYPHQKAELLWRTATSKEAMDGEIAWKRAKTVDKELEALARKIKPFVSTAKTHEETVDLLVQSLYETLTGFKGKSFPENWEHAHNQNIMCYRLYYKYEVPDPDFPAAVSPRDLVVPTVRPEKTIAPAPSPAPTPMMAAAAAKTATFLVGATAVAHSAPAFVATSVPALAPPLPVSTSSAWSEKTHGIGVEAPALLTRGPASTAGTNAAAAATVASVGDERRRLFDEVRAHLELLKEFEGAVPESEINQRKRELFAIMPTLSGSLASLTAAESAPASIGGSSSSPLLLSPPKRVKSERPPENSGPRSSHIP